VQDRPALLLAALGQAAAQAVERTRDVPFITSRVTKVANRPIA